MNGWGPRAAALLTAVATLVLLVPPPQAPAAVNEVLSIRSHNIANAYVRHAQGLGRLAEVDGGSDEVTRAAATWTIVPGLVGGCVSLESRDYKNHYLRHRNGLVTLERYSPDFGFRQDATFCRVRGLADPTALSLHAYQFPNAYLRHVTGALRLNGFDGSEQFRQEATFHFTAPWLTGKFYNPVLTGGADPSMVVHDGQYYLVQGDATNDDDLAILRSSTVEGLRHAQPLVVWRHPVCPAVACREVWAPELQRIGDRWWIFFTGQDGSSGHNHRMYALRSTGTDPAGPYDYLGEQRLPGDEWAIDGAYLTYQGQDYYVWSGWLNHNSREQHLFIVRMSDPMTPIGDRVRISSPTQPWETVPNGPNIIVNEAPQPIIAPNGRLSVVYSANASFSDDYCLGRLTLGGDPMDAGAWTKSTGCVFSGEPTAISPGHNGFFTVNGRPWLVYHAAEFPGGGWAGRSIRTQPMSFDPAGLPVLGSPTDIHQGIPPPGLVDRK